MLFHTDIIYLLEKDFNAQKASFFWTLCCVFISLANLQMQISLYADSIAFCTECREYSAQPLGSHKARKFSQN